MNKKKIMVLTDDMPWGHRSIARAIFKFLQNDGAYEVKLAEIKAETALLTDLYVFGYRHIPQTNKIFHQLSGKKLAGDVLKELSILNLKRLKHEVDNFKPDLIISTYFLHSHSLGWWREKEGKKFKLWSVVPDPWTINPMSFVEKADLNIVYDSVSVKEGLRCGLKKEKMLVTGWWTRNEMYQNFDKERAKKKLGFVDDRPVIFVGGGSLGTNSLYKILPSLLLVKKKVGLVINTGTDKLSFNLVRQFLRLIKRIKKGNLVQIKLLGWVDNMAEVLAGCDIVFGKAGPNFLFDCVAAKKPFVAITHIGGQEDGNIELIKKKKLGLVREKGNEISDFLFEYLGKPKYFEDKFKNGILEERKLNLGSLEKIKKQINKDLF